VTKTFMKKKTELVCWKETFFYFQKWCWNTLQGIQKHGISSNSSIGCLVEAYLIPCQASTKLFFDKHSPKKRKLRDYESRKNTSHIVFVWEISFIHFVSRSKTKWMNEISFYAIGRICAYKSHGGTLLMFWPDLGHFGSCQNYTNDFL